MEDDAEGKTETWLFHEVDIARVELILDIRREFTVDEETLSLVLGLLDQVYSLRRQMRRLCGAIESQPSRHPRCDPPRFVPDGPGEQ